MSLAWNLRPAMTVSWSFSKETRRTVMADARMPERFVELAQPLLPQEREPGSQGGRRSKPHHTVLKVIWFVLVTGCRWKDVPPEMGCCGETARMRLQAWERL